MNMRYAVLAIVAGLLVTAQQCGPRTDFREGANPLDPPTGREVGDPDYVEELDGDRHHGGNNNGSAN